MGLIIFLIMVVAAFNIVGTLTMVVARQDAGDRHPAGDGADRPARSAAIFLLQGAIIGLVGTAARRWCSGSSSRTSWTSRA